MRINNPKSLVNFTRGAQDTSAYNLATIGQLKRAINVIDEKYNAILAGNNEFGSNGLTGKNGYAWLNSQGKVDPTLLPPIAITNTHVVYQSELKAIKNDGNVSEKEDLSYILDIYVKNKLALDGSLNFQKGDIIIVKPVEVFGSEESEIPDPVYSGSYIITDVPPVEDIAGGSFMFSKIAYTDSNIVKINDKVPANSAGELHLYLKDILQEAYKYDSSITSGTTVNVAEAETKAKELSDSVYRLVTIDEGEDGFRFGFIDNSTIDGGIIPYAKLKELNDLDARETQDFNNLSDSISLLTTKLTTASGNLQNSIISTSGNLQNSIISVSGNLQNEINLSNDKIIEKSNLLLNEINYISGTIGDRTLPANSALSATIFAQTKQLRNDVDNNLNLLNKTRENTNNYLELIQQNVRNLHSKLNEKAIKIVEKEIVWSNENSTVVLNNLSESEKLEYQISSPDVTGILTWTYNYLPSEINLNNQDDLTENSSSSQERILGVYDSDGNEIMVDINRKELTNGLWGSYLSIDTEYVGRNEDGTYSNSLIGTKWTLIIAKTIVNIKLDDTTFAVGGLINEEN